MMQQQSFETNFTASRGIRALSLDSTGERTLNRWNPSNTETMSVACRLVLPPGFVRWKLSGVL